MIARFIGADEVIEAYEKQDFTMFSIWIKTQIVCQYNGGDVNEGIAIIKDEIERNIKRRLPFECLLKVHPIVEKNYTMKSDVAYNICFKSYEDHNPAFANPSPSAVNYEMINRLNAIESKQNALIAAIANKEVEEESEEESEPNNLGNVEGVINGINTILNHPLAIILTDKIMSALTPKQPQMVTKLAGTSTDDERISIALQTLFKKGLTVEKLEALAKMPALKIKSLLTMI